MGFGIAWWMQGSFNGSFGIGWATGLWIVLGTVKQAAQKIGYKIAAIRHLSLGAWGMLWAHMGTAVLVT